MGLLPRVMERVENSHPEAGPIRMDRDIADALIEYMYRTDKIPEELDKRDYMQAYGEHLNMLLKFHELKLEKAVQIAEEAVGIEIMVFGIGFCGRNRNISTVYTTAHKFGELRTSPMVYCSGTSQVAEAREVIREFAPAVEQEIDDRYYQKLTLIGQAFGKDCAVSALANLIVISNTWGPVAHAHEIDEHELEWRIQEIKDSTGDLAVEVLGEIDPIEEYMNNVLPSDGDLEASDLL